MQLCEAVYPREEWAIYLSTMIKIQVCLQTPSIQTTKSCWLDETSFCSPYPKPKDFFFHDKVCFQSEKLQTHHCMLVQLPQCQGKI